MSSSASSSTAAASTEAASEGAESTESGGRKRPRPGERRVQILQALATMLEQPGAERVTTAALAARLDVSEAALYRHFASKAQMFEGLIEFIEQSVFGLVNQLGEREPDPVLRSRKLVTLLLQFGEKNPGMARVMVGDALVYENERLQQRMNLFFDKIESALRQNLREIAVLSSATTPTVDAQADASVITAFCMGRLQRFARSGFKRSPSENLDHGLRLLLPDGRL
ncbi:nucleoid occlusion factor SlmA [Hydrogenophaga luteola]|uniref:Nucleoid occlusion factor SlmA n=1 Tax=Hydrogenophaga luteola TaxID=1591122 RepID=A0ABV7W676_9BURK